tara:strand:- start:133 stop:267 length:135 start_codon:yes stop_codon:yes gene_type:complete
VVTPQELREVVAQVNGILKNLEERISKLEKAQEEKREILKRHPK